MNCVECRVYKETKGKGTKACFKCQVNLDDVLKSGQRQTLAFEHLPQSLMENIAEATHDSDIFEAIRKLPLELSVPLVMQYVLNAPLQEIADYHKTSRQTVYKKNKYSLTILRTSLKNS
jgi:hypothetical protein